MSDATMTAYMGEPRPNTDGRVAWLGLRPGSRDLDHARVRYSVADLLHQHRHPCGLPPVEVDFDLADEVLDAVAAVAAPSPATPTEGEQ